MSQRLPALILGLFLPLTLLAMETTPVEREATQIVRDAVNHWRGLSSDSVMTMVIHRPDWERSMTMRAWTKGDEKTLVRVLEPSKDRGNGTLTDDDNMWTFSPKVNRVIKIPSSMMGQSWMGSDFSNNDLAKADELIEQYTHKLLRKESHDGHTVYVIESVPKEAAPVVWGREVVKIRDDWIMLEHAFYDQQDVLVKKLVTSEIRLMGGKSVAARERMQRVDRPGEWTEVETKEIRFGIPIAAGTFTLSNLRNPRE